MLDKMGFYGSIFLARLFSEKTRGIAIALVSAVSSSLFCLEFNTLSTVFHLFNGDSSQVHVSWTIF